MAEGGTPSEAQVSRNEDVVHIVKPGAEFTVVYGIHVSPIDPTKIPLSSDGVILESGAFDYIKEPANVLNTLRNRPDYVNLFPQLEAQRIPIILTDSMYIPDESVIGASSLPDITVKVAEVTTGLVLSRQGIRDLTNENLTRRRFLKGGGRIVAGAYLTLPGIAEAFRLLTSAIGKGQETSADLFNFSESIHPEVNVLVLKIRNALISYKEQEIARIMGEKPHLVTLIGAAHTGIEEQLKLDTNDNLDYLRALQPIISKIATKTTFPRAAIFEFGEDGWETTKVHEFPELANLVK